jgi:hypothetical protein
MKNRLEEFKVLCVVGLIALTLMAYITHLEIKMKAYENRIQSLEYEIPQN